MAKSFDDILTDIEAVAESLIDLASKELDSGNHSTVEVLTKGSGNLLKPCHNIRVAIQENRSEQTQMMDVVVRMLR